MEIPDRVRSMMLLAVIAGMVWAVYLAATTESDDDAALHAFCASNQAPVPVQIAANQ